MDGVILVGRLLVSLAVVLGVIWLIARRARKSGRGANGNLIEVLDRAPLSRGSSVAVIRVGEQALVVGVAENQVSVLGETDLDVALAGRGSRAKKRAGRPPARPAHSTASLRAVPAAEVPAVAADRPGPAAASADRPARHRPSAALGGSALSPQTWRQTIESLRDLTARA